MAIKTVFLESFLHFFAEYRVEIFNVVSIVALMAYSVAIRDVEGFLMITKCFSVVDQSKINKENESPDTELWK